MPPPPPSPETHWTDVEGAENIHHLTETNFESFIREHESVLVMFYAPCKLYDCIYFPALVKNLLLYVSKIVFICSEVPGIFLTSSSNNHADS